MEIWSDAALITSGLSDALRIYDWPRVEEIGTKLIARLDAATVPFPEPAAKAILQQLRAKRRFRLMALLADAFIRGGRTGPQIYRQYAQALIDQGNLTAAAMVLQSILGNGETPISEKAEANGLLGRIHKQLYVNANDPASPRQQENLRLAIQFYYDVYKTDRAKFYWQGINSVALLFRAQRDGIRVETVPESGDEIAKQIEALLNKDELDVWERATAVENAVALGNHEAAYDHALFYVSEPNADAFEIGSLLRQLTEVWQLTNDKEPGSNLIPTLRAEQLKREGGGIAMQSGKVVAEAKNVDQAKVHLERVFGTDRYQPLEWYRTGLKRCGAVGRVETITGTKIGTGLLVRASDFFQDRDEKELLFLTNAHVISPVDQPFPGAIPPEAARVVFEADSTTCDVGDLIWSSSPMELDATFVTIAPVAGDAELCPVIPAPDPFDPQKQQRVYVIGYPCGGGLSISLQDSVWLDTDGKVLHYRTPTDPGSSGSPVFDGQYWTLIALHHAGEKNIPRLNGQPGEYDANEGIAISAIQKATRGTAGTRQAGASGV